MSNNLDSPKVNTRPVSMRMLGLVFEVLGGLCKIGLLVLGISGIICALKALSTPSLQGTLLNIMRLVGVLAAIRFIFQCISEYCGGEKQSTGITTITQNINRSEIQDSKEEYQSDFKELEDYIEDVVAGIDETIQYDNGQDVFQELDEWAEALEVTGEEISDYEKTRQTMGDIIILVGTLVLMIVLALLKS